MVKLAASSHLSMPNISRGGATSSTKEDCIELAVAINEQPCAFWDGEDGVAMGDVFDELAVNVLGEFYRPFRAARRARPTALTGECYEGRVLTAAAVYPGGAVSKDTAV
jgi:hypothetical protein